MGDTTDPGRATHVSIKEMVGSSSFQAPRLRSGCCESFPPLATATAPTTTQSTAVKTRNKVKKGTPAIAGGTRPKPEIELAIRLACMSIATSRLSVRS